MADAVHNSDAGPAFNKAGIFFCSFALLLYQLLLTRIFSVIAFFHFAFVAISAAMLGLTIGSVAALFALKLMQRERLRGHVFAQAFACGLLINLSLSYLSIFSVHFGDPFGDLGRSLLTFIVTALPFVSGGFYVSAVLALSGSELGSFYGADLMGAGLACPVFLLLLKWIDAPSALLLTGLLLAAYAFFSLIRQRPRLIPKWGGAVGASLLLFWSGCLSLHLIGVHQGAPLFKIFAFKLGPSKYEPPARETDLALFEKWNTFSRVRVTGDPGKYEHPNGWGFSAAMPRGFFARQVNLVIDGVSGTTITGMEPSLSRLEYLKYDLVNSVHFLRKDARVFVAGVGGGRDILAALVFGQKEIHGAEINPAVISALNGTFGDFSGHLDRKPEIRFINEDARSYLSSTDRRYDVMVISLVDTFASSAAGALALTENSLYTTEGFGVFISRLAKNGILSVSRLWPEGIVPPQMYRVVGLAKDSLGRIGIHDLKGHVIVMRIFPKADPSQGVGTVLISREPFNPRDLETLSTLSEKMGFEIVPNEVFEKLLSRPGLGPPTDDRPFFFQEENLSFALESLVNQTKKCSMTIVLQFLIAVTLLSAFFILLPILGLQLVIGDRKLRRSHFPSPAQICFFLGIGMGYLCIEIALIQKLNLFLGHPVYALSVTLLTLLLSSGLGSMSVGNSGKRYVWRLCGLCITLFAASLGTRVLASELAGTSLLVRIFAAGLVTAPLGLFMGMMLPIGMGLVRGSPALAQSKDDDPFFIKAWLWGINGAASVVASVAATILSVTIGIATSYWVGVSFYLTAVVAYFFASRTGGEEGEALASVGR